MAEPEETEAEHPGQHGDEHHFLDAEFLHTERDEQDAERLGCLREGDQRVGVLHSERVGQRRIGRKRTQEGIGVAVRNLERSAQQHREDEEHGELAVLEQGEGLQAESVHERCLFPVAVDRAVRHAQGIETEDDGKDTRRKELRIAVLHGHAVDLQEVGQQHAADETDGAEHADGRELFHRVHALLTKCVVSHGVGQRDGRHEEGQAAAVEDEQRAELDIRSGVHAIHAGGNHEDAGQALAEREHFLRLHPVVGHDAHERRHEDRHDALHRKEPFDMRAQADVAQIASQRREVGSPDGKLQEVHHDQSESDIGFRFHYE